jgi:Zn-dependent peptidase ImmA (M78 family)
VITPIAEDDLVRQAIELAARTRRQIEAAGLQITDFDQIARMLRLTVLFVERPDGEDGAYLDDLRQIVISTKVKNEERVNFTFLHELMHAIIQDDPDLLSACHDVPGGFSDDLIERLCNKGAAEMLVPSEAVRQYGCSVALIPTLCEQFSASSLAVAFQMINCADDVRYLVIAELRTVIVAPATPLDPYNRIGDRLVVAYGAKSPAAKYSIRRNRHLPLGHGLYHAMLQPEIALKMEAEVPIGENPWFMRCECVYFRQKVFAFFYERSKAKVSPDQMRMF